jgi:parallel beta-helix repeat protein/predicted outer membrane repeat protein
MTKGRGTMRQEDRRRLAIGASATVGATLLMGGTAQAATFTVDSLADPTDAGHTTLHDAIAQANALHDPADRIVFASGLSGSIGLTTNLPNINYSLEIDGPGASQLTVSGNHARGIFHAVGLANPGLQVSGLTLRDGNNVADTRGGAIFLAGGSPATVSDTVFTGNTAQNGGAIDALNGSLGIQRSTFTGNTTTGTGGAIHSYGTEGSISDSVISGNGSFAGGGVNAIKGSLGTNGSLLIQGSTVSGNTASDCCGGIYTHATQTTTIRNSTISGNTVAAGPSGGVYIKGPLSVIGSTITGNASAKGGGIYGAVSYQPTLRDSIVAGNSAPEGPDLQNSVSAAFSLIGNTSGAPIVDAVAGSNLTNVDPQLQPLAANGGPTPTMAPASTSPAIDKGAAFGLSTDQRGLPRPFDVPSIANSAGAGADGSDIGAVEYQAPAAPKKKCKKKHKKHKRSAQSAKKKHKKHGCKKKKKKRK